MTPLRKTALCSLLALLACSLSCDGETGQDQDPTGQKGCPGNANVEPSAATALATGVEAKGYLCPTGNQHWFRLEVPQGQRLLAVDLHNETPLSPVTLGYVIRSSDGTTLIDRSPALPSKNARQTLLFTHCVPQAGTYYLQVQSTNNEAADTKNPFFLSYSTSADPDTAEPQNGDPTGAVALGSAEIKGYVSCRGDRDFYKIVVPESTLLDIRLSTSAATPALNLKYTLVDDKMAYVADDAVASGRISATNLRVVRAAPQAGTYYVIVSDQEDGSDAKVPYSLKVSAFPEPDGNERPTRNDLPATATPIAGPWACGTTTARQISGYLASRADADWYKLTLTGVGPACPATLQVSAIWSGGSQTIRPQISLVYQPDPMSMPDPNALHLAPTMCMKDEDCRVLRQACADDNSCEYMGHQCNRQLGKCTGTAVCLPEKVCGVLQFFKQQVTSGDAAAVSTSQPLVAANTYYIRVRDFQSQGYDVAQAYTLSVRLAPDVVGEPNNFYSPYVTPDTGRSVLPATKIVLDQTYTGKLGSERDQDFYTLVHPCLGQDCTLAVTYSTSADSAVYFTYQIEADGQLWAGWPTPPMARSTSRQVTNQVFGGATSTCLYAAKKHKGPYLFWVGDLFKGGPLWDQDTTYTFSVSMIPGCSMACLQPPYLCGK